MPPLICVPGAPHKAVFLVTTPISFGMIKLSKGTYNLLAKHVGMSMNSVSHWLVVVIDRGLGPCYYYELMSDNMAPNALGKNYFRSGEISPRFIEKWSSCYFVGETTKPHEEIEMLGKPRPPPCFIIRDLGSDMEKAATTWSSTHTTMS
jgi:hypothetical protein